MSSLSHSQVEHAHRHHNYNFNYNYHYALVTQGVASTAANAVTARNESDAVLAAAYNADESDGDGGIYLIVLPFIVSVGVFGNIVSLVAIFHSRLRKTAANQYLIVLTTADSVFLLGIVMVLFKVDYTGYVLCMWVEYVLMSASYVSSWSIAALTIERYLAIAHPLKHVQWGHVSRWRVMCFWVPIPFLLNLIQFVILSPNSDPSDPDWHNVRKCTVKGGQLQMVVELLDVVLCYVLPCITVVVLNLLIASKVESAEKMFLKPPLKPQKSSTNNSIMRMDSPKLSIVGNGEKKRASSPTFAITRAFSRTACASSTVAPQFNFSATSSKSGSTRILVVVPLVYIVLNSPFYMFRIIDTIALNLFQCKTFSIEGGLNNPWILFLYNAAHYLYYVNFACDFAVYAISSKNFRRTVVIVWRRLLYNRWSNQTDCLESMARGSYRYACVRGSAVSCANVNGGAGSYGNFASRETSKIRLNSNEPNSVTSNSQANGSIASTALHNDMAIAVQGYQEPVASHITIVSLSHPPAGSQSEINVKLSVAVKTRDKSSSIQLKRWQREL